MTDLTPPEQTPDEVSFGAAPTDPSQSRGRRTGRAAAWVAVGAIGATALTGVAFAASNNTSSTTPSAAPSGAPSVAPSGAPGAPGAPGTGAPGRPGGHGGPGGPGGRGGFGFGGLRGDVLHGEFVVKDGTSTKTMLGQQGAVTAVSSTELTVKSTDGFVATWALSSSTKVRGFGLKQDGKVSDIKVGASVTVTGTKTTDTSGAATDVGIRPTAAQLKTLQQNAPHGGYGRGGRGPGGAPGQAPAPAPTSTTAPSAA